MADLHWLPSLSLHVLTPAQGLPGKKMSGANMRGMRAHVRNVLPCRHAYIGLRALQRMSKAMSSTTCGNLILVAAVATVRAVVDDVVAVVNGGNAPDLGQPIG